MTSWAWPRSDRRSSPHPARRWKPAASRQDMGSGHAGRKAGNVYGARQQQHTRHWPSSNRPDCLRSTPAPGFVGEGRDCHRAMLCPVACFDVTVSYSGSCTHFRRCHPIRTAAGSIKGLSIWCSMELSMLLRKPTRPLPESSQSQDKLTPASNCASRVRLGRKDTITESTLQGCKRGKAPLQTQGWFCFRSHFSDEN